MRLIELMLVATMRKWKYIYTYLTVCVYIYMVTPPSNTRLFHTVPQVASLHWSTTHICRKHREYRYNRAFRHVHANRAATSRGFDMCINLVPNLGCRLMIVYVLDKLKCWRARYFCSCSTKKPRVFNFAFYSVLCLLRGSLCAWAISFLWSCRLHLHRGAHKKAPRQQEVRELLQPSKHEA